MQRRRLATFLVLGLIGPIAITSTPAAALEQDLVASATAGPPGTVVTLSSASCTPSGDAEAFLDVALWVGTGADEELAGFGSGFEGSASVVVPDWVDPDLPASIEGSCTTYTFDEEGNESSDEITYDPIAFDLEPGIGDPVQVPTFSRTSMLLGQGTAVSGTGCEVIPDAYAYIIAVPGEDVSGREDFDSEAAFGFGDASTGSFEALLAMSNATAGLSVSESSDDDQPTVEIEESPNTLPVGPYTVFTYCVGADGSALVLRPSSIDISGSTPTNAVDLTVAPGTREVLFDGESAPATVTGELDAESTADLRAEPSGTPEGTDRLRRHALRALGVESVGTVRRNVAGLAPSTAASPRLLASEQPIGFEVEPVGGAWSYREVTNFDTGIVWGFAVAGDPLGDGFFYDPQIVEVDVPPPPPETVPPTTTAPPAPAPANAVQGVPTYAG